nr:zinc finger, CCHC-type [Tanacetum cinerariifolium]
MVFLCGQEVVASIETHVTEVSSSEHGLQGRILVCAGALKINETALMGLKKFLLKKMHFLLTTLKVVYVLTTPMPELVEDATVEAIRIRVKWENDDYICRGHILNGMSDSLFDVYTNVESAKELWDSLESKYMVEDSSSKKFLDFKHTLKHGKDDLSLVQLGSHLRIEESLRAQASDKRKGKKVGGPSVNMTEEVVKRTTQVLVARERGLRTNPKTKWIDSGATTHVCKDRCWFKTFEPVEDGSVYESDKYILSKCGVFLGFGYYNNGMFMLNLNKVPDDSDSVYMSFSSTVVNTSLWHARLEYVHYKRMLEMYKDDLIFAIDENLKKCTTYRGGEYYDPVFSQSVGIIHETTALYTPQQNGVAERKNIALKEMVNYMLSYSGLSDGFWGEAMITTCYLLNRGCRVVVRLPDPKRKTLGKKGIDCIFVGYFEHSKAYRFYVIEPNDSISINSILESRDAIFDENRFSSIPRPKNIIPNVQESEMDDHTDDVPNEILEPQKVLRKILEPIMKLCNLGMLLAGKEAEWLRNLIHEIPIWPKPIAPIYIRCDSAPTMAKAYSQIYNEKSRHLGVRHSMESGMA